MSGDGRLAAVVVRPSELENSAFLSPLVSCDALLGDDGGSLLAPVMVA